MGSLRFVENIDFSKQNSCVNLGYALKMYWNLTLVRGQFLTSKLNFKGVLRRIPADSIVKGTLEIYSSKELGLQHSQFHLNFVVGQETVEMSFEVTNSSTPCLPLAVNLMIFHPDTDVWNPFTFETRSSVDLPRDLLAMLNSAAQCFTDVKLKCGDVVLPAHKCVLSSRSPVFRAMFLSGMRECEEDTVHIDDIDPIAVKNMLHFMYTGQIAKMSVPVAYGLLFAADKYQLAVLKDACIEYLRCNMSKDNVLTILVLGELHNTKLKSRAVEFICHLDKFSQLEAKQEWKTLKIENPQLAMEVYSTVLQFKEANIIPVLK